MLSPKRRRALEIIRDFGPLSPGRFAQRMWPKSPCWSRIYKCGPNGASRGIMMAVAAGGFLAKLRDDGLIIAAERRRGPPTEYDLSFKGLRALGPP